MLTPILTTKLYLPPARADLLARPRLFKLLEDGAARRLTLISASAGFGKTTLLSQWCSTATHPSAWLSLDAEDNHPTRFLTYLIAALQTIQAEIGEDLLPLLESNQQLDARGLLSRLINELSSLPADFYLVWDDYHYITDPQIHQLVAFLIDNLPQRMHLLIASRSDPPWSLARLRAQRQLVEIRSRDLRFSAEETRILFREILSLDLSSQDLDSLDQRLEGWIAGLQMAALAVQDRDISEYLAAIRTSDQFILDFLLDEVISQQPTEIQAFLLGTAWLERFNADLCDAVLEQSDSQDQIDYLFKANLFLIALDADQCWYRYHHLFADLLLKRQGARESPQLAGLHKRASVWFEEHGFLEDAVRHTLAAGDMTRLAKLVESNVMPLIYQERLSAVERLLNNLPEAVKQSHPWLLIAQGWIQAYSGNLELTELFEKIPGLAERAAARQIGTPEGGDQANLLGHACAILGYCEIQKMNYQAGIDLEHQALELLPESAHYTRGFSKALLSIAYKTIGQLDDGIAIIQEAIAESELAGNQLNSALNRMFLGMILFEKGQIKQAADHLEKSRGLAVEHFQGRASAPVLGQIYSALGYAYSAMLQLEKAGNYLQKSISILEKWERQSQLCIAYGTYAQILHLQGSWEGASLAIEKAIQIARNFPHQLFIMEGYKAEMELSRRETRFAEKWIAAQGITPGDEIQNETFYQYQILARWLMAKGAWADALAVLDKISTVFQQTGSDLLAILLMQACAQDALHRRQEALELLAAALELAESSGHRRPFLENGLAIRDLLQAGIQSGQAGPFAGELLGLFPEEQKTAGKTGSASLGPAPELREALSERELEILRLLNTHLSSTEIARDLHISPNTVRFHIKNIYSKLQVNRRADAVQRAKELNLR